MLCSRFFRRRFWDDERAREIQSHIEIETDEIIARGMFPEEAQRAARKKFGNVAYVREEIYRMNTIGLIESLWHDLRYACRSLRRNRGLAVTVIVTLALAIGANTTIFSVVDAAMFRPLPYRDPSSLVSFKWIAARGSAEEMTLVGGQSLKELEDWRTQKQVFAGVEPYSASMEARLTPTGEMETIPLVYISPRILDLLGVHPKIGRGFLDEEGLPGNDQVALLSEEFWLRHLGADPAIVSKNITLDNHSYTVVGVMPRDFQFPPGRKPNAWVPWTEKVGGHLSLIARLRPGLNIDQAEKEVAVVSDRIYYRDRVKWGKMTAGLRVYGGRTNFSSLDDPRAMLLVMAGAVGFVLLIACANVANLLLSRGTAIRREVAIRAAIGASRGRLVRQFLVESLVLSAAGAVAALLLSWWLINVIPALLPEELRWLFTTYQLALNARVLIFTGSVMVLACLMSGLVPSFRAAHGGVIGGLTGTNRIACATRSLLKLHVAFQSLQICLALVLLCGAGLMINSFARMALTESGFDTNNLYLVRVSLPSNYPEGVAQQAYYDQLLLLVKALPGVQSATAAAGTPATSLLHTGNLIAENLVDANAEPWASDLAFVRPDYFSTLRIPILYGRNFGPQDGPAAPPVVIVDRRTAEHYWPGQSALGQRIRSNPRSRWNTVVGVIEPVKTASFINPRMMQLYKPLSQGDSVIADNLIIRTSGDSVPILAQVRTIISGLSPHATVKTVANFDELYAALDARVATAPRFYLILLCIFAGVALTTAAVGIYGVLSYSVAQRTSEIGVRMALGASARDIRMLLIRAVLAPVSTGIVLGIITSLWLTRLLRTLLYEISPHDPITIISVIAFLLLVSLAACFMPCRRAVRVEPMTALRIE